MQQVLYQISKDDISAYRHIACTLVHIYCLLAPLRYTPTDIKHKYIYSNVQMETVTCLLNSLT